MFQEAESSRLLRAILAYICKNRHHMLLPQHSVQCAAHCVFLYMQRTEAARENGSMRSLHQVVRTEVEHFPELVTDPQQLLDALISGTRYIEIRAHLDLTGIRLSPGEKQALEAVDVTQSIRVSSYLMFTVGDRHRTCSVPSSTAYDFKSS